MPSIPEDELKQKLLDEGFVPRAMQDDNGFMYTIPEENRERFADRIIGLFRQYAAKERLEELENVPTEAIHGDITYPYLVERIKQLKEEI